MWPIATLMDAMTLRDALLQLGQRARNPGAAQVSLQDTAQPLSGWSRRGLWRHRRGQRTHAHARARLLFRFPLAGAIALTAAPALATSWGRGVFPVSAFAGFTSGYGMRIHPLGGDLRPHYGIDIAAPLGSPVRSWWSGRLQEVIRDGGCGNGLVIRSGDYEHLYCHLAGSVSGGTYRSGSVLLRAGQPVPRGAVIGHVGLSGSTTGPHLHWGLRHRGRWLDPARILRAMAVARRRAAGGGAAAGGF